MGEKEERRQKNDGRVFIQRKRKYSMEGKRKRNRSGRMKGK
jgi:hypothetical protein